jgi:hypothetical protein
VPQPAGAPRLLPVDTVPAGPAGTPARTSVPRLHLRAHLGPPTNRDPSSGEGVAAGSTPHARSSEGFRRMHPPARDARRRQFPSQSGLRSWVGPAGPAGSAPAGSAPRRRGRTKGGRSRPSCRRWQRRVPSTPFRLPGAAPRRRPPAAGRARAVASRGWRWAQPPTPSRLVHGDAPGAARIPSPPSRPAIGGRGVIAWPAGELAAQPRPRELHRMNSRGRAAQDGVVAGATWAGVSRWGRARPRPQAGAGVGGES